jgi:uncharacterized membrane protein YfcA
MPAFTVLEVMASGTVAGTLGAMLGLGGGVFLVPFLVSIVGLPFNEARGISLLTVIATSSAVAAINSGKSLINFRLGMMLQVSTSVGALLGGLTSRYLSEAMLTLLFAVVMISIGFVMILRLDKRNVLDVSADPGPFGGRFFDTQKSKDVAYRLKRTPLAIAVAFAGGNVSSLLGIGGGVLLVPALNLACGIPIKPAAATSSFMIGVTAVSAAPIYYGRGDVVPHLAAAAVLGVLVGSAYGMRHSVHMKPRRLKQLMAIVLFTVAGLMLVKLARMA